MKRLNIMAAPIALLLVACVTPAEAYRAKRVQASQPGSCSFTNDGRQVCGGAVAERVAVVDATGNRAVRAADDGTVIGSRPSGCPHSYCGCGLRMYLGLTDVRLNLASNWARLFPHESAPRAGLAAVRSGHVMYIEAAAGDGQWLIRDYNSGGGLSRVHVRDVHGYAFVNPHAQVATR
ncbi:MAG TPA: hypothetical protein VLU23_14635 [Pseudolabrys sp.]|jgi:hypothetical protein|nr:hypothetical protein [Pseudolabrys sp.]